MDIKYSIQQDIDYLREQEHIVRAILQRYKNLSAAVSDVMYKTTYMRKQFEESGLRYPCPAAIVTVFQECSQRRQTPEYQSDEAIAAVNKVYVAADPDLPQRAIHYRVDRQTEQVTIAPSDYVAQMTHEHEEKKPGIGAFVGELVNVYDFTAPLLQPYGDAKQFEASKVCPSYEFTGLVQFGLIHGSSLQVKRGGNENPIQMFPLVVDKLVAMPQLEYLRIQTEYYVAARGLKRGEKGYQLFKGEPLRQVGQHKYEGQLFFERYPNIPRNERNWFIYRQAPWTVKLPGVPSTAIALNQLQADRAWRGEDKGRYSGLTGSHATGGHLPKARREVALTLSIVLPLLKQGVKVYCIPKNVSFIPEIDKTARALMGKTTFTLTFEATGEQLQTFFQEGYMSRMRKAEERYHTVIMNSTQAISFTKKENPDDKWELAFPACIPAGDYTRIAKVPPLAADKYNVFQFASAHAFDFMISSRSEVKLAAIKAEMQAGQDRARIVETYYEYSATKCTSASVREFQYRDNRRKLTFYLEMRGHYCDPRMNLYIPEPKRIKGSRDLLVPVIEKGVEQLDLEDYEGESEEEVEEVIVENNVPAPVQARGRQRVAEREVLEEIDFG